MAIRIPLATFGVLRKSEDIVGLQSSEHSDALVGGQSNFLMRGTVLLAGNGGYSYSRVVLWVRRPESAVCGELVFWCVLVKSFSEGVLSVSDSKYIYLTEY